MVKKDRVIAQDDVQCPFCQKVFQVKVEKICVNEPIKGEYQTVLTVEKKIKLDEL